MIGNIPRSTTWFHNESDIIVFYYRGSAVVRYKYDVLLLLEKTQTNLEKVSHNQEQIINQFLSIETLVIKTKFHCVDEVEIPIKPIPEVVDFQTESTEQLKAINDSLMEDTIYKIIMTHKKLLFRCYEVILLCT